jgi:2-amino-4-hydroxy-6-hydroxymethyldihydropteridine diphosphokinase
MQSIEAGMGRSGGHLESREIDLDLITYGAETGVFGPLVLPHPRFHSRAYVLIPLQEIAPRFVCPRTGAPVAELVAHLGSGVERISGRTTG